MVLTMVAMQPFTTADRVFLISCFMSRIGETRNCWKIDFCFVSILKSFFVNNSESRSWSITLALYLVSRRLVVFFSKVLNLA